MKKATFETGEKYFGIDLPKAVVIITIIDHDEKMISYSIDGQPDVSTAKIYEGMGGDRIYLQAENRISFDAKNKVASFDTAHINGLIIKIGQRIMLNCGTPFPLRYGKVILLSADGETAVVQMNESDSHPIEYFMRKTCDIHWPDRPPVMGNPLGMFVIGKKRIKTDSKFEVGERYFGVDDPDAIYTITVTDRSADTISYTLEGHPDKFKAKIFVPDYDERIHLQQIENKVHVGAEDKLASAKEFFINGLLLKIGQRIMYCGGFSIGRYAPEYGNIIQFDEDGTTAVIQLNETIFGSGESCYFRVATRVITQMDWRLANSDTMGIFIDIETCPSY